MQQDYPQQHSTRLIKMTDTVKDKVIKFDVLVPSEITITFFGLYYTVTVRPHTQTLAEFQEEISNCANLEAAIQQQEKDIDKIGES